ncbi:MAG: hypothetical protein K1Y01_07185 [Vicinamibacteria bacterium]|nr:hypothetical protein [Vicinamibacteria bacterium]
MNMKNLLVVVSAVALATSAAAQSQPSLTELAKAEKARRSKVQKAGGAAKTYTESDRTGGAAAPEGESATASTPTGAAATGSATKKKDKTPEEIAADQQKEWNDKVKAAQDQIKETEATIARNERVLASLINITPQRVDLANSIEADKKKLADLQKSLADLEDQRRRAGMPRPR